VNVQVTHVVPALFARENVFGGAERYALELARAMAARMPTRFVSFGATEARLKLDDLEVKVVRNWVPYRRFRFDPFAPSLLAELWNADVVHVHQPETMMGSMALACAKTRGIPIFASHLGGYGLGLHRVMEVDDLFDGHLHISEFSRRHFGHAERPDARTILGGVDVNTFRPPAEDVERRDVVFVGRLLPHKGINYLIEAMDDDVTLSIIGRRWQHAMAFDELLIELAKGKQVCFLEGRRDDSGVWAPNAEDSTLVSALQSALCVVLPSVHTTIFGQNYPIPELLGLVVLEGMACGAPAIVTNVCSLPEVVVDGVTGFVVPPNDPGALRDRIRWLRVHPDEARRMGAAARRRVLDAFTWDRVVDRCLEAYASAVASREPSRARG
jgi:glycosyltransferase involved in cell wall biosynthesis